MKSRERVITALQHKEPDRVPRDMDGGVASGITGIAYNRLVRRLGIDEEAHIYDLWQQLAKPSITILKALEIDCVRVGQPINEWKRGKLPDGSPCWVPRSWNPEEMPNGSKVQKYKGEVIARMPKNGYWFEPVYALDSSKAPLVDATIDDLADFTWMVPFSFDRVPDMQQLNQIVDGLQGEVKWWYKETDFALVGAFGASIFETAQRLRGMEQFFIDLIKNRKFVEALLDRLVETNIEYAKRYLEAVQDCVQVIIVGGEDIGTQTGLQINPEIYREVVKPHQKNLWQFLKRNSSAYLQIHTCGNVEEIIDDLIDAGIDILNPVQISAGMDPIKLKERFGTRITFWGGGVDTQHTLPFASQEEVKKEVRERIAALAPGGGYVFAPEQNVQPEVPVENVLAMYQAAEIYGQYPIEKHNLS